MNEQNNNAENQPLLQGGVSGSVSLSDKITFVRSRYPDAKELKYAKVSMVIWSDMLNCRVSGFSRTFDEAWDDAFNWILKKEQFVWVLKKEGLL